MHYEKGALAYTVNAAYRYDQYANLSELVIASPEGGTAALTITSTFANSTASSWVIGNKTREIIQQSGTVLKDTQTTYLSGTQSPSQTKNWVNAGDWSTQTLEYDAAGNETVVCGPGPARRELQYDDTYSTITSSKMLVSAQGAILVETSTFSLEHGKALSITDPNGRKTSYTYDVLGRIRETMRIHHHRSCLSRASHSRSKTVSLSTLSSLGRLGTRSNGLQEWSTSMARVTFG